MKVWGEVFPARVRGDQSLLAPAWSQTWLISNPIYLRTNNIKKTILWSLGRTEVAAHMAEGAAECWEGERRVAQA